MPKIVLRGSEFDKVEWNIEPFPPGTIVWNPPKKVIGPVKKEIRRLAIQVPCRLNLITLDVTRLYPTGPDLPIIGGAGSVSFAADIFSHVEIELIDGSEIILTDDTIRKPVVKHAASLIKNVLKYDGGLRVEARDHGYHHVGLGSTAILAYAVAYAINISLGNPLNDRWLIKTVMYNYAEEGPPGLVFPGFSTGATGWIAKYGGGIIVSPFAELVHKCELPEDWSVIVGIPPKKGSSVADSEVEIPILDICRHYDRFMSARVCHWILTEFFPAMVNHDLKKMGDVAWDIVLTCTNGLPTMLFRGDVEIIKILHELRRAGIEMVFESSIGPGVIAITTKDKEGLVKDILNKKDFEVVLTNLNNKGLEILEKDPI